MKATRGGERFMRLSGGQQPSLLDNIYIFKRKHKLCFSWLPGDESDNKPFLVGSQHLKVICED